MSEVLLVGTGLMIGSVRNLLATNLGVDARGVVRTRVSVPARTYASDSAVARFYTNLEAPVVSARTGGFALSSGTPFYEPGRAPVESGEGRTLPGVPPAVISAIGDYFGVVGIRVTSGRNFGRRDALGGAPVAIVSEGLAKRRWPGANPVGHTLRIRSGNPAADTSIAPWRPVVAW